MVLVLLRRLSSDVFAVGYTPRGLPITNRDMKFAIMDELDRRIDMEEPQEQSDARAASGQDSRTSREVPDKGKGRDDGEEGEYSILLYDSSQILTATQDVDSSPISPGEYKRLITVVTNNIVEAISLPIPLEDIPCRGRPRASLADIREAIRTVLIQRGLRELGEDVVCTLAGKDRMGIDEGGERSVPFYTSIEFLTATDLTPSLKVSYEVIYDQEVATMVWVLNHPIPIPGISLPADEVRERLLLEFRLRCWRHAPSQMRARWEDDPEDVYEQRTCEVVVESLGGRPAPDLSHRDSSRMSDASKHERRADERLPIQLRCFRPWTRKGENGILGRQRFSRLRETTSRLWDEQSDLLSQDLTPRLGDLRPRARNLDDRSLSDGDEDRASELGSPFYPSASRASDDFHERKREQDIPRFGLGLGLGRRGLSLSSLRDDRQERESRDASRDQGFEGQRFGGGLGSRLKSRSRDDGFSDAQESRRLRSSGSFGHDSVAQAIRGWGTSGSLDSEWRRRSFGDGSAAQPVRGWGTDGGLRSRLRSRSRDNDFSDAQEPRRLRFGGDLGSGWGRRTVWEDYADAQGRLETFSPRDRERYNDLMDRWWGCGC